MELYLKRKYYKGGTNGMIIFPPFDIPYVYTIELPWLDNKPGISCIPGGKYRLKLRYSRRHKTHLMVCGVEGRSLILIHPANNAVKELKGCIAPVAYTSGEGRGGGSRRACKMLLGLVQKAMDKGPVYLTIK